MRIRLGVALVVLLAACSSGGSSSSTTTTTAPPQPLVIRLTAPQVGLGCVASNPTDGVGSQVTVKDATGTIVGTATFALTPGAEVCDFTASVPLTHDSDFLTIEGSRGKLVTVKRSDVADHRVTLTAGTNGTIEKVS